MKVLFDLQIFSWQKHGGVSRYYLELANKLSKYGVDAYFPPGLVSNSDLSKSVSQAKLVLPDIYIPGKIQTLKSIDKALAKTLIRAGEYNLFHPTSFDPYFLHHTGGKPYIITIFDMIHELFPGTYSTHNKSAKNKALLAKDASAIITISESTKRDIVRILGVPESKVHVIHLASALDPNSMKKVDLPSNHLVYVGDRHSYKNFSSLITSLKPIMRDSPALNVVCVGGGKFTRDENMQMGIYSDHFSQHQLTDQELAYCYTHATALVYPSIYEGFGLPLLEAMSCGCPVVASDASSMPEVAGKAAYYFDPDNIDSMTQAIKKVIGSKTLRDKLIKLGATQSNQFSWDKCAKQTTKVYQQVIAETL